MVAELRVTGGKEVQALSRKLRAMGEAGKGFRKELNREIDEIAQPLAREVQAAELVKLPKRGGLAAQVARRKVTVSKTGTGIRLQQRGGPSAQSVRQMDQGRLRHPLWGNRGHWYTQQIPPGMWSDTLDNSASRDLVRKAVLKAVRNTNRKLS